jgi:hypothetical protein
VWFFVYLTEGYQKVEDIHPAHVFLSLPDLTPLAQVVDPAIQRESSVCGSLTCSCTASRRILSQVSTSPFLD